MEARSGWNLSLAKELISGLRFLKERVSDKEVKRRPKN
jgi:hypothetical protein